MPSSASTTAVAHDMPGPAARTRPPRRSRRRRRSSACRCPARCVSTDIWRPTARRPALSDDADAGHEHGQRGEHERRAQDGADADVVGRAPDRRRWPQKRIATSGIIVSGSAVPTAARTLPTAPSARFSLWPNHSMPLVNSSAATRMTTQRDRAARSAGSRVETGGAASSRGQQASLGSAGARGRTAAAQRGGHA